VGDVGVGVGAHVKTDGKLMQQSVPSELPDDTLKALVTREDNELTSTGIWPHRSLFESWKSEVIAINLPSSLGMVPDNML